MTDKMFTKHVPRKKIAKYIVDDVEDDIYVRKIVLHLGVKRMLNM